MTDPNIVLLRGRLTKDAEVKPVGEQTIIKIRLAVNGRARESGQWVDKPNFFDVTYFARGEGVVPYLLRGKQVFVQGRLDWREWVSNEGGKRQAVEVIANDLWLTDGGGEKTVASTGQSSDTDEIPF
jgi:single-strand DNA-binding protein